MANPPEYLQPILMHIEMVVVRLSNEYPILKDKDIEWCFSRLKDYYSHTSSGRSVDEPSSNSESKQDLMDEILNLIEERIEAGDDFELVNTPHYTNGGKQYENISKVYAVCFSYLYKSAKLWRKGKHLITYLSHIRAHLPK